MAPIQSLIVFATTHGFTEKCVKLLEKELQMDTRCVNLEKASISSLAPYNPILIGGSIHMGKIQKVIAKFCSQNLPILLQKQIGLFLSCMGDAPIADKEFALAFPVALRKHSQANCVFGGAFYFDRMNLVEKFIVNRISGRRDSVENLRADRIRDFANTFAISSMREN